MESSSPKRKQAEQLPTLPDKIWPEKNIEKWSIWIPANSRSPLKARTFTRKFELANGTQVIAKLEIGFTHQGTLTTEEQRVYYALVKLWEEHGRLEGFVPVSLQRLSKLVGMAWGQRVRKLLNRALWRLRATMLTWENAFIDSTKGTRLELLHPFTILDDLKIAKSKTKGHPGTEVGYFRFHEAILKNLLANHTTPLLFDVVLSFKSELAQILYTHLDLILADKTSYERRTKELFEDLGLEGKAYKNLSDRKRVLERALKELTGKPITTGKLTTAHLRPTKDGTDLKLVIRKGKATEAITAEPPSNVLAFPLPVATEPPPSEAEAEAEALVKHFHKHFHGAEEHYPTRRALDQAATLIARHGAMKARHIVEFAHREAPKTKFKAATFGAVIQYEARAIKDFDFQEEAKRRQLEHRQAQEAREHQETAKAEAEEQAFQLFLDSLTEEERKTFEAEAVEKALGYGLGPLLRRYRAQENLESPSAKTYRLLFLRTHFEKTR
jgi:hypothetical protein